MRGVALARVPRDVNAASSYRPDADGWRPAGEHDLSCKWGVALVLSANADGRVAQAGSGVAGASRVVVDTQTGVIVAITANGVDSPDTLNAAADALLDLWR